MSRKGKSRSGPVSRVLFPLRNEAGGEHSSRALVAQGPHQRADPGASDGPSFLFRDAPLLALASSGVCRAGRVAPAAVRSYRTVSPLPPPTRRGGLFSVALSCGSLRLAVSQHLAL